MPLNGGDKRRGKKKLRLAALIACGELCKTCSHRCGEEYKQRMFWECPICGGASCEHCEGGRILITECPRNYIGQAMTDAVNVALACRDGILPSTGGLLDQSAKFFHIWQQLRSDENLITQEQIERAANG